MNVLAWASSVKSSLATLQQQTGIPALWAAAQSCHESAVNGGERLSSLAQDHCNYAGLKAARWQREQFGCGAVSMRTWEHIEGQGVDLTDAFCSCPSWEVWLQVYAALLTSETYRGALAYKEDPFLYGLAVWESGWATDPAYLQGVGHWMQRLFPDYADTIPGGRYKPVAVRVNGSPVECRARLEIDHTRMDLRPVAEALGATVVYREAGPVVDITLPQPAPGGGRGTTNAV